MFNQKDTHLEERPDSGTKTKWLQWVTLSPVDLAGELLDLFAYWRQTRRWRSILTMIPIASFAIAIGAMVASGKLSDSSTKATWYADRAMKEIELAHASKPDPDPLVKETTEETLKRLPEFIDMLFRRVLQINQNNKLARYYVAVQMDRYGSRGSARQMMESLATTKNTGYSKAHTWLSLDLIERAQKGEAINVETLKYHLKRGTSGSEVPPVLLLVYSQLLQQENKTTESQEYLKRAAEFDPKLLLSAIAVYNQNGLPVQARATADLLVEKVKNKLGDNDGDNLVLSAQAYVLTNRIDDAIEILRSGSKRFPMSGKIARAYSDAYRFKFRATAVRSSDQVNVNLDFLNAAIAIDPTNIFVQEELTLLAKLGIGQNESTLETLRIRIATSGTSYVARLLLAESSFGKGNLEGAINEYEVILAELPRMTLAINNLAMMYTQVVPPRLDEAIELIDRAIAISPTVSEFHDSRGDILAILKRTDEAIASYLLAIGSSPDRVLTREKLIAIYEQTGHQDQAQMERDRLAEIRKSIEEQRTRVEAALKQSEESNKPADRPTLVNEEPTKEAEPVSTVK